MRATSNDQGPTALLMGIDVKRINAIAWALSATFSAFAGLAFCMMSQPRAGDLRARPARIPGDDPRRARLDRGRRLRRAGDRRGREHGGPLLGRGLKEIAGFVLIIVVLMVKPYGLFGQREIERV